MANTVLQKALKTDLKPSPPTDLMPGLEKQQKEARQAEMEASSAVSALEEQKIKAETEAKATQAQQRLEATESAEARKKTREEPLLAQDKELNEAMMKAHFEPSKENLSDQAALFSLINVIGFAIGAGGKQNAQAAMAAMNGMLEGHQQGRADVFREERATFDKNLKALQQRAAFVEKELAKSLQEYTRDKDAGLQRADVAFAQAQADFMKTYAQKNGLVKAYEMAKEVRKNLDKAVEKEQARQLRNEDNARRDIEHRQLILATQQPKTEKTTTADQKIEKEKREKIAGIRGIERLQEQLRDPEVKAGLQAKVAPLLEKLGSLTGAEFESAVNSQLTGTDKTTLFLKDALLETYAIERAAKGGQRLTVQDMKMVGPVLDPTNYSPATYNALLDARRRVLYDDLQDMGMSKQQIKEKAKGYEYEPYSSEQVPTITNQQQYDALPPGAYFIEDGKRYQKPRSK